MGTERQVRRSSLRPLFSLTAPLRPDHRAHAVVHGARQPPYSSSGSLRLRRPPDPGWYVCTGAPIQQRLHPRQLFDPRPVGRTVLLPTIAAMQRHLVRVGPSSFSRELHIELDWPGAGDIRAMGIDDHPDAGGRVQPDDELIGLRVVPSGSEAK